MSTTYATSTYDQLIDSILDEVNEPDRTSVITPEAIQRYILDGCQVLTTLCPVWARYELRLLAGVEDYVFADTPNVQGTGTVDIADSTVTGRTQPGTGTISSSGEHVTGSGTQFTTQLTIGQALIVGNEAREIRRILSNTSLTLEGSFTENVHHTAYSYSTTKFFHELVEGSIITVNAQQRTIQSIENPFKANVTQPFTSSATNQSFTINTKVTEIPTKFHSIDFIERLEGSLRCQVALWHIADLSKRQSHDGSFSWYSTLDEPFSAALFRTIDGRQFLKFYPVARSHKQVTLYGIIRILPTKHYNDSLSGPLPLTIEYEPMMREYAKAKVLSRIKEYERSVEAMKLFYAFLQDYLRSIRPTRRIEVDTY